MMKKKHRVCRYLMLLSIAMNILFLLPYAGRGLQKIGDAVRPVQYWKTSDSDELVVASVARRTMNLDIDKTVMITDEYRGLFSDLRRFVFNRRSEVKCNYFTSYGLVGVSYLLLWTDGKEKVLPFLQSTASKVIDKGGDSLNYSIEIVDQVPIGIVFINLYRATKRKEYLELAEHIYNKLLTFRSEYTNLIGYRSNSKIAYVDAVGMYVPFLMEYFATTQDSLALQIAKDNMKEFYRYGIDKETGIPMHGYSLDSKMKVGSANWGRGIGWYLLAAAYCPFVNDSLLNQNVMDMDYSQFPGSSKHFDSSTAIMAEIYKYSKGLTPKSLNFIKPYVTQTGMVDSFSGDTYGINDYSHQFGESELGNGLLLMYYYRK